MKNKEASARINNGLRDKIAAGERITPDEAVMLFSWDILDLGRAGDLRRRQVFPEERVGFIIDRIINFTNICEAGCDFCAYHSRAGRVDAYELSLDEICSRAEGLVAAGGTQVMLQGGLHPDYTLDHYIGMVRAIKARFPNVYLHSFSPAELVHMASRSGLTLDEAVKALKAAGLDSVPGASDLLVERIRRRVSPRKLTRDQWCEVMYVLHDNGVKSSATMTYGMGETIEERVGHLATVREIQDRTGVFRAFIPWSFSPAHTDMEGVQPATGIEYLKVVAVSRIFLDNILYIQAGWLTEGLKLAQIALTMGANDMGGVLMEEVVVKATGIETKIDKEGMIEIIKNAGKIPVQRDSEYRVIRGYQ